MMTMLQFALIALSITSTPANAGVGGAAADYLRPVLSAIGGAARINYAGVCPGHKKVRAPSIGVRPAPPGTSGMAAVREIFRNDPEVAMTRDESGMLTITIGSVSTSALQTRLPELSLSSAAQYTPMSAIVAISNALQANAAEHVESVTTVIDIVVSAPIEGRPHLPPVMQNISVDDALDSVARTFKGIVLYGACTQPDGKELFDINYIDGS